MEAIEYFCVLDICWGWEWAMGYESASASTLRCALQNEINRKQMRINEGRKENQHRNEEIENSPYESCTL